MSQVVNIQVTLPDDQVEAFLKEGVNAISSEQMGQVICDAMREVLCNPNKELFIKREYYSSTYTPTPFLEKLLSQANLETALAPVTDEVISYLKDNYVDVLRYCIMNTFTNLFFTQADRTHLAAELSQKMNIGDMNS